MGSIGDGQQVNIPAPPLSGLNLRRDADLLGEMPIGKGNPEGKGSR